VTLIRICVCFGAVLGLVAGSPADDRVSIQPRVAAKARADIRVDSSLVLVPVNVTDSKNRVLTGLNASAFRVFEGKTEQQVLHLSTDDQPLTIGIVFDSSWSMAPKLAQARAAVREFVKAANPEDEFFLVNFNTHAELSVPFTRDPGEITAKLENIEAHGKAALIDGVYLGLHSLRNAHYARKALLIFSDGGDNDSRYSAVDLRKVIRESDAWVYAIGIYSGASATLPEEERGGPNLLDDIAGQSGGRQISVERAAALPEAAAEIGRELRNRYVLAYSPANATSDGKYHRVQVRVVGRNGVVVSSRPGYYAPER
jgi:Ca-activated chloride channel homolog